MGVFWTMSSGTSRASTASMRILEKYNRNFTINPDFESGEWPLFRNVTEAGEWYLVTVKELHIRG